MSNNDERHYKGQKLNIIFAVSSILLLGSLLIMFRHDYDREWKDYQREFRKMEAQKTREKLYAEIEKVESSEDYKTLTKKIDDAEAEVASKQEALKPLESELTVKTAAYELVTQKYQFAKAQYDSDKYVYETALAHHEAHAKTLGEELEKLSEKVEGLRLAQEGAKSDMAVTQAKINEYTEALKVMDRERRRLVGSRDLLERKLSKIDPSRMSFFNQLGDLVRNEPVLDMLNPTLKVEQTVLKDITDDVNFMRVPKVDRCMTCHLGALNPDYKDAPQPFTTHPNLELFLSTDSPHPVEEFGCTSCHDGRGRGTGFTSAAHTPNTEEQEEEWKEKYSWQEMHHWEKRMFPSKYIEAGCFKCHENETVIPGAEKLNLGLNLIEKAGCYGCHTIQKYEGWPKAGPSLKELDSKFTKDWAYRWIKDPKSFRHNTRMPSFFNQSNTNDPQSVKRTDQEIHAIIHYLFNQPGKENDFKLEPVPFKGSPEKGKELVASLGCYGCHEIAPSPKNEETNRAVLRKEQGPNLIGLGTKTSKEWLYNWLKNPSAYNHNTLMPDLRLSDEEASDIAAFLSEDKNEAFENQLITPENDQELTDIVTSFLLKMMPKKQADEKAAAMPSDEKLQFAGEKLIRHYGCFACHEIRGFENEKPIGTELTYEGSKPTGKLAFESVHEIGHTNFAWFHAKLKNPRIFDRDKVKAPYDKLKMPNFNFTDAETEAVVTALLGFVEDRPDPSKMRARTPENIFIEKGQEIVRQFNCQGCHLMEGEGGDIQASVKDWLMNYQGKEEKDADAMKTSFSPPNLIGEGAKVQTDWLFQFIHNPQTIRPWLKVRMPTFNLTDEQRNSLVKYFNYLDKQEFPFEKVHEPHLTPEEMEAAKKLFSPDYFGCVQCHIVGDKMPEGSPENWAPDFALAKKRLKPDWIIKWIKDPAGLLPGTKMPTFFDSKFYDVSGPDDILDGDEDRQITAMRDYMWTLKEAGAAKKPEAKKEVVAPSPAPTN